MLKMATFCSYQSIQFDPNNVNKLASWLHQNVLNANFTSWWQEEVTPSRVYVTSNSFCLLLPSSPSCTLFLFSKWWPLDCTFAVRAQIEALLLPNVATQERKTASPVLVADFLSTYQPLGCRRQWFAAGVLELGKSSVFLGKHSITDRRSTNLVSWSQTVIRR